MEDYKVRFVKEYKELKEKLEKLDNIITKHFLGELDFTLSCPIELLVKQEIYMSSYLKILEERAKIEEVDLTI